MALTTVSVFLTLNKYLFYAPRDEAVEQCLAIASAPGNVDWRPYSKWLRRNSISLDKLQEMAPAQKRKWVKGVSIALNTLTRETNYLRKSLLTLDLRAPKK